MAPRRHLSLLLLAVFWAATFLPHLLSRDTLPARDIGATQIPWHVQWRDQVRAGTVPIWDPASNQGRPMLANPNTMSFYPGNVLFLLLPPEVAAAWHLALHHLIFLAGCYVLARRSGAMEPASALAAAAAGTCGVAFGLLTFLNAQAAMAWAPWALATATAPPHPGRTTQRALVGGALLGLAFLAGEPIIAGCAALAWTIIAATTWPSRRVATTVVGLVAMASTAAPVLVPLLAIYGDTVRGALGVAHGALAADSLAPRRYLELWFPRLLGAPLGDGASGFWAAPSFPWQRYYPLIFTGSLPWLMIPFARRVRRPLGAYLLIAALGLGGAIALGIPAIAGLLAHVPGLRAVRYGIKPLVLVPLALAPLVAAGYEGLALCAARTRRRVALVGLLVPAALTPAVVAPGIVLRPLLAAAYPASRTALARLPDEDLRRAGLVDLLAVALPATVLALPGLSPAALTAATLTANALGGAPVLAWTPARTWEVPPAIAAQVPEHATIAVFAERAAPAPLRGERVLDRFWAYRNVLVPSYATRWGMRYVLMRGPDGLEPVRSELVAAAAAQLPDDARARLAWALGADVVIMAPSAGPDAPSRPGPPLVLRAEAPAQAAYLAERELPAEGLVAAVHAMSGPAFRSGKDATIEGRGGAHELGGGDTRERAGSPHDRSFDVNASGPGLLVVRQSFMRCWRAQVDHLPVAIEVVNGAQLGVRLPAGRHTVRLRIDLLPYRVGFAGPLLVALAFAVSRAAASRDRAGATRGAGRSSPATPPVK